MKAILKYELPDEEKDFQRASKALDMALALWDIQEYLRAIDKKEYDIESIRDAFYDILNSYSINLDKLIE